MSGEKLILFPITVMAGGFFIFAIANSTPLGMFASAAFFAMMTALIVALTIIGASVLGTNALNETTTTMVMKFGMLGAVWGGLTGGVSGPFLAMGMLGLILYSGLTMMFVIGLMLHIRGGSSG